MSALQHKQQGYHRLETDDEVVARLKEEGKWGKTRPRYGDETFDQWLEAHNLARKLRYIP